MALLQTAPRFDSTMKILNRPPRLVMVDRLPGLFDALHWPRAEQNPFQGFHLLALGFTASLRPMFLAGHILPLAFLLAGRLWLPHPHRPELQRITSGIRAFLGRKQLHACPTELHLGGSGSPFMFAGHLDAAMRLGWPGCGSVEQMIQLGFGLLLLTEDPSILGRAHQEEGAHLPTALQKGKT